MLQIKVIDELRDDFCVGVALESETLVLQEHFHLLVIGDNAIVDNKEGVVWVRPVRVRI